MSAIPKTESWQLVNVHARRGEMNSFRYSLSHYWLYTFLCNIVSFSKITQRIVWKDLRVPLSLYYFHKMGTPDGFLIQLPADMLNYAIANISCIDWPDNAPVSQTGSRLVHAFIDKQGCSASKVKYISLTGCQSWIGKINYAFSFSWGKSFSTPPLTVQC